MLTGSRSPLSLSHFRNFGLNRTFLAGVCLLLLGAILVVPASAGVPAAPSSPSPSVSFPTPIQHVFTILLENEVLSTVLAQGPYETALYNQYAGASQFYGVCHPSAPNYLGLTSGQPQQCGSDAVTTYSVQNIADLVTAKGETWVDYQQSMPGNCVRSDAIPYVAHHNPFIYYKDITSNSGLCNSHVLPLSKFNPAITPANYVWVSPDRLNDGHTPQSVPNADKWLQSFLPNLLTQPWAASTVFLILYDEGDFPGGTQDPSGYAGLTGGHTFFVAVSPYSKGQGIYSADASPYNVLATTEWLLGTGNLGQNDASATFPAMKSLFNFSGTGPPPSTYAVSGVASSLNGTVPAGLAVTWSNQTTVTPVSVNAVGAFSTLLPNGSYTFTATAPGYQTVSQRVSVQGAPVAGIVLTLIPGLSSSVKYNVSGSVSSANGTVPPGVVVAWSNTTNATSVPVTAHGTFSTELPNGTYAFSASAPGFLPQSVNVTVHGAPVVGVLLNLSPGPSALPPLVVTGVIHNDSTGNPIAGARVLVANASASEMEKTSANGSFAFHLTNGTYGVRVNATGFDPLYTSWTLDGANLTVRYNLNSSGSTEPTTNGSSAKANPVIVKVVAVGSNAALANVTCVVTNVENNSVTIVKTDSRGLLRLALSNGTYSLVIRSAGYSPAAIDLLVQGPQLVPLPVPLEPARSPGHGGSAPIAPVLVSIGVLAVLGALLVACVTALGASWIWATARRAGGQRQAWHFSFRRRR